jgi:sn-glycerol 3-phosphate transport system ATP-binding protein
MADVQLRSVSKSFGTSTILRALDASIPDGSFVVVVGPSGCGKSTLLRLVAGLEVPDSGEIRIGGDLVNTMEPGARNVAMVFQNYALYPHMSVAENIGFGLSVRGMPRGEIATRVADAARVLGIEELLSRRPRQLSGGQRQRVAMGRAMVRQPRVFLFDEPLSNLDAKLRVGMRTEIKRLHRELGTTSLYVTHDQVEAMTLGDRLIVMNGGLVEQQGAPLDIYLTPATAFVAAFIGSPPINFLTARPTEDGLMLEDGTLWYLPHAATAPVLLGIRAEHLLPCAKEEAHIMLACEIIEPQGAETIVHGTGAGQRLTARLDGVARIAPGEMLPLRITEFHLFDRDSGRRIAA